jgi:hypothetical protein
MTDFEINVGDLTGVKGKVVIVTGTSLAGEQYHGNND